MLFDALRQLWPVAAALALIDAVVWVKAGRRLLVSRFGRRFALFGPGPNFAGVLPSSRELAAGPAVLLPAGDGVWTLPARDADTPARFDPAVWTRVPWEGVDPRVDVSILEIGSGRVHLDLGSSAEAEAWRDLLTGLAAAPPGQREKRIGEAAAAALDVEPIRSRRAAFEAAVRPAEICAWLFLAVLFAALPAALYLGPPPPDSLLAALLALTGAAYAATLVTALRAARRLRRQGILPAKGPLAPLLLAPPAAVRAVAALGRDLLPGRDPLAVAAALLPARDLLRLVRAERHGAAQAAAHPQASEPWSQAWSRRGDLLLALLTQTGIEEAEALALPARRDPAATAWCPLCDVEVRGDDDACADCALPLQRFPPAA
ncbi:MAG TPA: hypothetical protein VEG34_14700 [Thermoanaerobaculia bacterium]|nr:hypothetical protein [Thermoanaerobaculia bacterium]